MIHYCWFGKKEKPEIVKKCIQSWKKYCPDWEIKEWNEDNFDVNEIPYMREAYETKKWAFVSDVARLLIIYRYGGVYMDTDVELIAPIQSWIDNDAFFIFESERNIASGAGVGSVKGHKAIKAMLDVYDGKHFLIKGKMKMIPCPAINTEALSSVYKEFKRNGKTQQIRNVQILSTSDYSEKAIHHGMGSWVENYEKHRGTYKDTKIKRLLRNIKIFEVLERYMGKKATYVYTFMVYDLLEMGPIYFIKRLFHQKRK